MRRAVCAPHLLCPAVEIDGPKMHVLRICLQCLLRLVKLVRGVGSEAKTLWQNCTRGIFHSVHTHGAHLSLCSNESPGNGPDRNIFYYTCGVLGMLFSPR